MARLLYVLPLACLLLIGCSKKEQQPVASHSPKVDYQKQMDDEFRAKAEAAREKLEAEVNKQGLSSVRPCKRIERFVKRIERFVKRIERCVTSSVS